MLIPCRESLRSLVANTQDYDIVFSEFDFKSGYYVHFWTNILGKFENYLNPRLWVKLYHYCKDSCGIK